MGQLVLEGLVETKTEDGGQAMIAEISGDEPFFVRLHSWDETGDHRTMRDIAGRRVRVTIDLLP